MGCTQNRQHTHRHLMLKPTELKLLQLMYSDVAHRSPNQKITKENFYLFFQVNGLWCEKIFNRFDVNKNGMIEYEEFLRIIEDVAKGGYRKKVKALFSFYEKEGYISFEQLVKMLYSYPGDEIKKLVQSEEFIGYIAFSQKNQLRPTRSLDQSRSIMEHPTECPQDSEKSGEMFKMKTQTVVMGNQNSNSLITQNKLKRKPSFCDQSQIVKWKKQLLMNIPLLVQKYAVFLFGICNLKKGQQLQEQDFIQLTSKYPQFFSLYFQGFLHFIWQVQQSNDPKLGQPEFISKNSEIQSFATELFENEKHQRFLKYYKNTLFIFKSQKDTLPCQIKILEGLIVQKTELQNRTGFIIKHRNGFYPEKSYMFSDKQICEAWMNILSAFRKTAITELFYFEQKIFIGNTCEVYRGAQRTTGKKVAIKVFDKYRRPIQDIDKAKSQSRVIETCNHPYIVKFIKEAQTKVNYSLVMEYVEENLEEYVKRKQFLEEYETSIIMKQLFQAILYLNDQGLVHRNLSPSTIMICKVQDQDFVKNIKLISFGQAVFIDSIPNSLHLSAYVGMPDCTAPQMLENKSYDQTVDSFSLGVVMYFMLCGLFPFQSLSVQDLKHQILNCSPDIESEHWQHITDNAKDLMMSLMCKKQKRRHVKEAIKHPWIVQFEQLKDIIGRNRHKQAYFL